MKTIICLSGKSNIGKTATIQQVWKKIGNSTKPMATASANKEILAKFTYKNHLIGIESFGDPHSKQSEWIEILIKAECKIIVCASRSYGETVEIVENYAKDYGYAIIWVSPIFTNTDIENLQYEYLKELSADMIIQLIEKCITL